MMQNVAGLQQQNERSNSLVPTSHPLTDIVHAPPKWWRGRRFANIVFMSIGFMLVSTAYFTVSAISNSVIHDMGQHGFHDGDGYISLAILYATQLTVTPIVPLVIKLLGGKCSMFVGGITQLLYASAFELNSRLLLFVASGVFGFGMNLFWTGNGVIFTANSSATTANKYAGIFWVLYNFSQIWGNIVVAVKFNHIEVIDDTTRRVTFGALIAMVVVGCIVFMFIKEADDDKDNTLVVAESDLPRALSPFNIGIADRKQLDSAIQKLKPQNTGPKLLHQCGTTFSLLASWPMLLSLGFFTFTGYNQTVYTSLLPTAVGFDRHFGDARKQLIGITGFCTGTAEVAGGLAVIVTSDHISRTIIWIAGVCFAAVAMGLSALNLPLDATVDDSSRATVLFGSGGSSITICLVCAVLFGLSDAATSISMIALMSDVFGHEHEIVANSSDEQIRHGNSNGAASSSVPSVDANSNGYQQTDIQAIEQINSSVTMPSSHGDNAAVSVQQFELESSATAFAVLNGTQSIVSTVIFFLSNHIWLDACFYAIVPICIWSCLGYYWLDRNFRAGKYQNYFRNLRL